MPVIQKKINCPFCDSKIEITPTTDNPQNIYCSSCKNKAEGFLRYLEFEGASARSFYDRKYKMDKLMFLSISVVITLSFYIIFLMMPYIHYLSGNHTYNLLNLLIYTVLTPLIVIIFTLIPLIKARKLYNQNLPVKIYFYKDFIVINNRIIWDRINKRTRVISKPENNLIEIITLGSFGNSIVPHQYDSIEANDNFIVEESDLLSYYDRKKL